MRTKALLVTAALALAVVSLRAQCAADFTYNVSSGTVNFSSTSTITGMNTGYFWTFGDGGFVNYGASTEQHVYLGNGTYTASLLILDSTAVPQCSSSISKTVVITGAGCGGVANFTYNLQANGLVNFSNSSAGATAYLWSFGDGGTSTSVNPLHTYTASGVYNVTLTASALPSTCTYSTVQTLTVVVAPCSLNAAFTYSAGTGNAITFSNTSAGITASTNIYWSFGDGGTSQALNPSHTYTAPGNYFVQLMISDSTNFPCWDSTFATISVGNPCLANVSYSLMKDSVNALTWNAYPSYPSSVTAVSWTWGDGSTSSGLYPSHTFSAAGMYSICVSVTVSCGSTGSFCTSSSIFRSEGMIQLNVIDPANPTGIGRNSNSTFRIFPNPVRDDLSISLPGAAALNIYDALGNRVRTEVMDKGDHVINTSGFAPGMYFIRVDSDGRSTFARFVKE